MLSRKGESKRNFRKVKTLGEASTDSEQYCQDCGFVGHAKGSCTCNLITIRFEAEPGVHSVEIVEARNNWTRGNAMLYSQVHKAYIVKQFMPPGKHTFKFVVNGVEWQLSSAYPTVEAGKGIFNNFIVVEPINYQSISVLSKKMDEAGVTQAVVRIYLPAHSLRIMLRELNLLIKEKVELQVHGNWDDWKVGTKMTYELDFNSSAEHYFADVHLPVGEYRYKFTIDGHWTNDPFRAVMNDARHNHGFDLRGLSKIERKTSIKLDFMPDVEVQVTEVKVASLELFKIYGHSLNVVGSKIWIFGGCCQSSVLGSMIVIDPRTFSTEIFQVADHNAPAQLGFHKTITYGQKILMFGGNNEGMVLDRYSAFDTIIINWTSCAIKQMPQKREMFSLNHKAHTPIAYLFGGYYCSQDLEYESNFNDLYALHLDTMRFEMLGAKSAPKPRCHHAAELIQSSLYVFGGMQISGDSKVCFNDMHVIDTSDHDNMAWKSVQTVGKKPCARYGHIMLKLGNKLIVHGGTTYDSETATNSYLWDLWVFNVSTYTWSEIKIEKGNGALGRAFHAGCLHNGNLIIYGGKFKKRNDKHR